MIQNLLAKLPGPTLFGKRITELKEIPQDESRAQRVQFHRERVRNGPAKFSTPTNGQVRRARKRAEATSHRKQLAKARRNHWQARREAAVLRSYLQAAGIMPYDHRDKVASIEDATRAITWLYVKFGKSLSGHPTMIEDALQAAWAHYCELTGTPFKPLVRA